MLMLSWNCQGVGRPLTVSHLRELCRAHHPEVVFLMETKNKEKRMESIRRSLHFSGDFYIHPAGLSGGLALWWKDNINIHIISGER